MSFNDIIGQQPPLLLLPPQPLQLPPLQQLLQPPPLLLQQPPPQQQRKIFQKADREYTGTFNINISRGNSMDEFDWCKLSSLIKYEQNPLMCLLKLQVSLQ